MGVSITVCPSMILLTSTADVQFSPEEGGNGTWDENMAAWRFGNDQNLLDELLARFGEDLDELRFEQKDPVGSEPEDTRGEAPPKTDSSAEEPDELAGQRTISAEIKALSMEVTKLHESLDSAPDINIARGRIIEELKPVREDLHEVKARLNDLMESKSEDAALESAIKRNDLEIARLREQKSELQTKLDNAITECESSTSLAEDREREIADLQKHGMQRGVLRVAKELSGQDKDFMDLVDSIDIEGFRQLPLVICEKMKKRLRSLQEKRGANTSPAGGVHGPDLFDLLNFAQRGKVLDHRTLNAAHYCRYLRQRVAHPIDVSTDEMVTEDASMALAASCIIAAAIVWPELRRAESGARA
jgi:hypothetical protein